jgi:hypothetical protein
MLPRLPIVLFASLLVAAWFLSSQLVPAADAPPKEVPVIVLADAASNPPEHQGLYFQIIREAFLMAARDEFGAATFDAALRETAPPADAKRAIGFEMSVKPLSARTNLTFSVNRVRNSASKDAGKPLNISRPLADGVEQVVARGEQASREDFVAILKASPLAPQPLSWRESAEVPETIEQSIDNLSLIAEFRAARLLHALIREDGESPERLAALSRAYANLGMLTEHFWTVSTRALAARSLLYAERLCVKAPNSLQALWCRGYARALTGRHHSAIADFDAAAKLAEAAQSKRPRWAALAEAFVRFDRASLRGATPDRYRPLARWLYFLANETSQVPLFEIEMVNDLLQVNSDAYRAIDLIAAKGNWSMRAEAAELGQRGSGQQVYAQLGQWPGLPDAIGKICERAKEAETNSAQEYKIRGELFQAIRKAAQDPANRAEPGLAALATLLEDVAFVQVGRSLANSDSAAVDGLHNEMLPLVESHPFAKLFGLRSKDRRVLNDALKFARELDSRHLTLSAKPLLDSLYYADHDVYSKLNTSLFYRAEDTLRDQTFVYFEAWEKYRDGVLLGPLRSIAPNMPVTVGGLLTRQTDVAKPDAARWASAYADIPDVMLRLGRFYRDTGNAADAERIWRSTIKSYPNREAFQLLSDLYESQGDGDRWLTVWGEYFEKAPEIGLEHAHTANIIAAKLMERRQWQKAWPYAERAANSGAAWALSTAGGCAEALQKWGAAEEQFSRKTQSYSGSPMDWYFFCRRTGFGNAVEARQVCMQFIDQYNPVKPNYWPTYFAVYYALDRQFEDAFKWAKGPADRTDDPTTLIYAALLADRENATEDRDRWLKKVLTDCPLTINRDLKRPELEMIGLAELIVEDLAAVGKGAIDLEAAKRRGASAPQVRRSFYFCLLGEYLDARNQRAAAVECWKLAMLDTDLDNLYRTLAGARLFDAFVPASEYREELLKPLSKEAQRLPAPLPLHHPPDAAEFNGHFYKYFVFDRLPWNDAKQHAQWMGGQLACITSEDEQKFVAQLTAGKKSWLGGHREDGKWKWVSGELFEYQQLNARRLRHDWLRMMNDGTWWTDAEHPGNVSGFICEWEK